MDMLCAKPLHQLQRLDLSNNQLGDRGAKAVSDGLRSNDQLEDLLLDHNDIDSDGAEAIAAALLNNQSLKTLSLEWNSVRLEGGRAIANALLGQRSLTSLNLGWNGLSDEGVVAIASTILTATERGPGTGLTTLKLHHNRISTQGAACLGQIVGSLKALDVSGNPLGVSGSAALLLALQQTGGTPCALAALDVCVRPDTTLDVLLRRVAAGGSADDKELQAAGVFAAGAATLAEGAEIVRAGQTKKTEAKKAEAKKADAVKTKKGGKAPATAKGKLEQRRNGEADWAPPDTRPQMLGGREVDTTP